MYNLPKKKILLFMLAAIAVLVVSSALALTTIRVTIHNVGTIKTIGLGVYADINCTNALSSFDWGVIDPGSVENHIAYIRNEGNMDASLYLETANWDPPEASDSIAFSWDYSNQTVEPNEAIQVTFTLSISSNITGIMDFNFDIIIGID